MKDVFELVLGGIFIKRALFNDELYDYTEHEDGSKTLHKARDKNGFKITIHVSGDHEEHKTQKGNSSC